MYDIRYMYIHTTIFPRDLVEYYLKTIKDNKVLPSVYWLLSCTLIAIHYRPESIYTGKAPHRAKHGNKRSRTKHILKKQIQVNKTLLTVQSLCNDLDIQLTSIPTFLLFP